MAYHRPNIPIAQEGLPFIAKFVAAGIFLTLFPYLFLKILGGICFLLAAFCVFFFRDPEKKSANDPGFILAPGDGKILEVGEENIPALGGRVKVIRIFLSVFDIHVQRSPIAGKVTLVEYKKGKFLDARDPQAAFENEQNSILIEGPGCKVIVRQIAGFIARRIACWVAPGDELALGQRLGLIRFGSQADLFLPLESEICVVKGERVVSGVTPVALLRKAPGSIIGGKNPG